jgi:hypothetical protein
MNGAVTLTTVRLLGPHLTMDNCERCLEAASYKTKREVEHLVASLAPQPDLESSVRRVPTAKVVGVSGAVPLLTLPLALEEHLPLPATSDARSSSLAARVPPRAVVKPLAPERYVLKVTVSGDAHAKLRRAQDLLRHAIPNGNPAAIIERALTMLVEQLERTRLGKVRTPRSSVTAAVNSRRVPANVKRLVWQRDAGRCAFVGIQGRCTETAFLEFHHVVPYAAGGATSVENLALRCRAHNVHEAVQHFGATRSGTSSTEARSERAAR